MKNIKAQLAMSIICVILGFAFMLQLKSVYQSTRGNPVIRSDQIVAIDLQNERERNDALTTQLNEYRTQLEAYQQTATQSGDLSKVMKTQLDNAEILSGQKQVEGPGITLTMSDSQINTDYGDPNNYLVHDRDVLMVLNELRAAGAEAISINDLRILSTSEIRCTGPTVSVNNTKTSAPFVIKAIGLSKDLRNALEMKNGVIEELKVWGINVSIKAETNLVIPAYDGAIIFKYAKPVEQKESAR